MNTDEQAQKICELFQVTAKRKKMHKHIKTATRIITQSKVVPLCHIHVRLNCFHSLKLLFKKKKINLSFECTLLEKLCNDTISSIRLGSYIWREDDRERKRYWIVNKSILTKQLRVRGKVFKTPEKNGVRMMHMWQSCGNCLYRDSVENSNLDTKGVLKCAVSQSK